MITIGYELVFYYMETQKRQYTVNPRSPPKRRRRTRSNEKQTQSELTDFSSDSTNTLFFPILSQLPPLPPSPIVESQILFDTHVQTTLTDSITARINLTSQSQLPPLPAGSISNLTNNISWFNLSTHTEESAPWHSSPNQFVQLDTNLEVKPLMNMLTSSILSTTEQYKLLEINQANKLLRNNTKFEHLQKDSFNFNEWKENTTWSMKVLISVNNYWDNKQTIISFVDRCQDQLTNSVISNTIENYLKDVTEVLQSSKTCFWWNT